jgi:Na+/H+ antiporter
VHTLVEVLALLLVVTAVSWGARRFHYSTAIALVLLGIAGSYLPFVPGYELDPEVVLLLFLPPLLYSAALSSSLIDIRANRRAIGLLSVGYVLFGTVLIAVAAHAIIPDLPWSAAFVLGAIVAPPDAVAATSVARRVGLPRRILTILEGESLVNDATALTAYRVGVAAVLGGGFSWWETGGRFALASIGGLAIGLAVYWVVARTRQRLDDPMVENALSLITPFVAYLPAEEVGASGVLAVVVTGLLLGNRAPSMTGSASRLQSEAVWRMIDFLLEGTVFLIIGLQLRGILRELGDYDAGTLMGWGAAITAIVIAGRFAWVYPATYVPRWISKRTRERDPAPPWQYPTVIAWAGMRGVVSLAAAFAIPVEIAHGEPFPARELILFLTFCVILGTLVLQGLTLPHVIRWLGLRRDPTQQLLAEAQAAHAASAAATERLDGLMAGEGRVPPGVEERLREGAQQRSLRAWERLGDPGREMPSAAYRRLRLRMLEAEREALVRMRDDGVIADDVMRRLQGDLDIEESLLTRWST